MALRPCRECSKEVARGAKTCPHCGIDWPAGKRTHPATAALAVVLALGLVGYCAQLATDSGAGAGVAVADRPPVDPGPQLEIQSWRWGTTAGGGYVEAEGEVKNITGAPLERVQAVVSFHTEDGTHITTETALIEFNPVLPGQVSPFRVMARRNPAMNTATLSFKELFGGTIRSRAKETAPKP